jgi:hypothetical protein
VLLGEEVFDLLMEIEFVGGFDSEIDLETLLEVVSLRLCDFEFETLNEIDQV